MNEPATLPPARERNRHGIRSFNAQKPVDKNFALFDRVALKVQGRITPYSPTAIADFASGVGRSTTSPLFERVRRERGRWASKIRSGSTISAGKLAVWDNGVHGSFEIELVVNPIRTLGHLLDRYSYGEIADLSVIDFFDRREAPTARDLTLDGNDNMIADFLAFSGSMHSTQVQRVAEFLRLFEDRLQARIIEDLCPNDLGYAISIDSGSAVAVTDDARVELDWSHLKISQCEVCWEWHDSNALARVHALADAAITSARSTEVNFYGRPTVVRDLGALAVRLPLSSNVSIVVYAKAQDRLRLEVRYPTALNKFVGDRLPSSRRTLLDWFDAIREHAAERVPWEGLHDLLAVPPEPNIDALADLLTALADATDRAKSKREGLLRELLRHGAVTGTSRDGPAPYQVLQKLADHGVLEHVRLVGRDRQQGRRYRLSRRYQGLVDIVSTQP